MRAAKQCALIAAAGEASRLASRKIYSVQASLCTFAVRSRHGGFDERHLSAIAVSIFDTCVLGISPTICSKCC